MKKLALATALLVGWSMASFLADPAHGTTVILLVNESGIVAASDSLQHLESGRLSSMSQTKVFKIRDHFVAGIAGPMGALDPSGRVIADLSVAVPQTAERLPWTNVEIDIESLKNAIANELHKIERVVLTDLEPDTGAPTFLVLFGGYTRGDQFYGVIKFVGEFVQVPGGHIIAFQNGQIGSPGDRDRQRATTFLATHRPSIQAEVMDMIQGKRDIPSQYGNLSSFARIHARGESGKLPVSFLELVATDIIRYTMDRDMMIGGAVQVVSISSPR